MEIVKSKLPMSEGGVLYQQPGKLQGALGEKQFPTLVGGLPRWL